MKSIVSTIQQSFRNIFVKNNFIKNAKRINNSVDVGDKIKKQTLKKFIHFNRKLFYKIFVQVYSRL